MSAPVPAREPNTAHRTEEKLDAFRRLLTIMDELREGCPWDREQTMASLRNLTIEETYELADAILDDDLDGVAEELGDLLLHMVFYARIGDERGAFDVADVLHRVCDKLVHRHPHIYGDTEVSGTEEVKQNWERLKLREGKRSVLAGVPRSLPALIKAQRMQEKAGKVGFEWDHIDQVRAKVAEEQRELEEAIASGERDRVEQEYGDLLFALVNLGRYLDVEPETALERTNRKFLRRFGHIERRVAESGRELADMDLAGMDDLWEEAKRAEREG
jgi:XTP/dITP diphosphohydrolase